MKLQNIIGENLSIIEESMGYSYGLLKTLSW